MKKALTVTLAFITLSFLLIFLVRCTKNGSAGCTAVCQNGGTCTNNACVCLAGYEGADCSTLSRDKYIGTYNGFLIKVNSVGKDSTAVVVNISAVSVNQTQITVTCGTFINNQTCTMNTDGTFGAQLPGLSYKGGYNSSTRVLDINIVSASSGTGETDFIVATKQ